MPALAGQSQATGGKLSALKVAGIGDKAYTGKQQTQKPVILNGSYQLKQNTDYTISYQDNVKIGTSSVILKGKGNYTGTVTKSFKINPGKTVLIGAVLDGSNVELTWKKNANADGYQLYYYKEKSGDFEQLVQVDKTNITYKIKGVKEGTSYYKVRAYKTVDKKNYYGGFSTVKSVTYKKAVTKGEIKIPKATDPSLTAPSDIHLGEYEEERWEGSEKITIKETVPGLFWTNSNETADRFYLQFYDENDNLIQAGMHSPSKDGTLCSTTFYSIDGGAENYTIKTIVITPVNSIDGSVNTDPASGQDKIGESTVFNCDVIVKVESGKKATIAVEKIDGNNEQIRMSISEKTGSYGSYYVTCNYKDKNGKLKNTGRGNNAESSGEMIIYESLKNFNERYKNAIKIVLVVYSDLEIKGADQASYTRSIYETEIKE